MIITFTSFHNSCSFARALSPPPGREKREWQIRWTRRESEFGKNNCIYKWIQIQSHFNLHALHNRCLIENSLFQQFGSKCVLAITNCAKAKRHSRPGINCTHHEHSGTSFLNITLLKINFWRKCSRGINMRGMQFKGWVGMREGRGLLDAHNVRHIAKREGDFYGIIFTC